ncbi:hypothetical protein ACFQ4G_18800 [Methylobacterium marchantiae]|uniref:Uncharacterized protein n=1 Tax=Methylobacterium marchantiae TaxID=600331 RepID=A0ABW3X3P9_9HYPH|nr:hypothetical protein AIGOOFII_2563 [Methylobacterium marchantiae]
MIRTVVSPQRASLSLVVCLALTLGACTLSGPSPKVAAVAPVAAPVLAPLPDGSGCGPSIARTQAVVDSDVATGNLNQPVGARFSSDLARAAEACRAGRDREAIGLLAAAKSRYGYP